MDVVSMTSNDVILTYFVLFVHLWLQSLFPLPYNRTLSVIHLQRDKTHNKQCL